jgi:hypothetical protein
MGYSYELLLLALSNGVSTDDEHRDQRVAQPSKKHKCARPD